MNAARAKHEWAGFFELYSQMFEGQPTRLGTFENEHGRINDYWIEDGLPLTGIDMDLEKDLPTIEIMLGDLTHKIENTRKVTAYFSVDRSENGLDIADVDGRTTILRFET